MRRKRRAWSWVVPAAIIFLTLTPRSPRAAGDTLTVDDVLALESAGEFDVSPDAKWIAWVKTTPDTKKNRRVGHVFVSSAESDVTLQLTRGDHDDSAPAFSPNGTRVAFLSARGKGVSKQIYVLDLRGGEAQKVTSVATGVRDYEWLDDDTFVFSAREDSTFREKELKTDKDDVVVVSDMEHYAPVRLFTIDLDGKKLERLTTNEGVILELAVSPDRRWVATRENQDIDYGYNYDNPPRQFLTDLGTGKREEICPAPHLDVRSFQWAADGRGFYCVRDVASDSTDTFVAIEHLYYFDLAHRALSPVDLGDPWGLGFSYYVVGDGVVAAVAGGVTDRIVHARTKAGRSTKTMTVNTGLPIRLLGAARDGDRVVYLSSTASTVPVVMTAILDDNAFSSPRKLADLNEPLRKKTLSKTEIVRWAGARGDSVEGILYYPPHYDESRAYPLVGLIHGGPTGVDPDFFTERWSNYPHVLAARGTFVLKVNYHGSGNYGLAWMESIRGHYYEYEVPDIIGGVDYLIARGLVDADKLGMMGWSNGSILAIACCLESDRFKVLCAGAGDVNWISDYGNCAFGAAFDDAYLGGPPWEHLQTYLDKSPLFRMVDMKTPTLIMFGTKDTSVPTEQGWQHFRAMQTIGTTPVRFLLFPGTAHGLRKLSHQRRKMEEELAWFDEYLFNDAKPKNEAFDEQSPLAHALKIAKVAHVGSLIGREADASIVPEIVELKGMRVSRFEITRAQFGAFDPNYTYPEGTDNYPVTQISLPLAQTYCLWLGEKTGRKYRIPTEEEMNELLEAAKPNLANENNLEHWVGYSPTPDELAMLRPKLEEIEKSRLLIEPVGSFRPVGENGVYDLGGNVAEWVTDKQGKGMIKGLCAVTSRDERVPRARPPLSYVGFRVIEE